VSFAIANDTYSSSLQTKANAAYQTMIKAYSRARNAYQALAVASAGTSQESNAQLQLASSAQLAGDVGTAITAYTRFLKIAPDSPNAQAVRQTLQQLKASTAQTQTQG